MRKLLVILVLEARTALITAIQDARDTLADPEKVQGRFSRDDKVSEM